MHPRKSRFLKPPASSENDPRQVAADRYARVDPRELLNRQRLGVESIGNCGDAGDLVIYKDEKVTSAPGCFRNHSASNNVEPNTSASASNLLVLTRLNDARAVGSEFSDSEMQKSERLANLFTHLKAAPPVLHTYWDLTIMKNTILQKMTAAVTAAYEAAFGAQIALISEFMIGAVQSGLLPHQPQVTPARALQLSHDAIQDGITRFTHFATMLAGFNELPESDQKILLSEKFFIFLLLHRARFFYKGENYVFFPGPERVHCCRSVLDSLGFDPDFTRYIFTFYASLNNIGMTLAETYLLLAAAIFSPEVTKAGSKESMEFVYNFYLDALFSALRQRLYSREYTVACIQLETIIRQFPAIDRISMDYFGSLSFNSIPVRPRSLLFSAYEAHSGTAAADEPHVYRF